MWILAALLYIAYTRANVVALNHPYMSPYHIPPLIPLDKPRYIYKEPLIVSKPHVTTDKYHTLPKVIDSPFHNLPDIHPHYDIHTHHDIQPYYDTYKYHGILPHYDIHKDHDIVFPYKFFPPAHYYVDELSNSYREPVQSPKEIMHALSDDIIDQNEFPGQSDHDIHHAKPDQEHSNAVHPDIYHENPEEELLNDVKPPFNNYTENLKAVQKFAADLEEHTHVDGSMTLLDVEPHYNALLTVLLALAENDIPDSSCNDFDSYYEGHYLRVLEENYPSGLLNPGLVSQKVKYYKNILSNKIGNIQLVIEQDCAKLGKIIPCNEVLNYLTRKTHFLYHEAEVLQAYAALAAAYNEISVDLMKVSEKYLELPYLLKNKEAVKKLVKTFYEVLEMTTQSKNTCTNADDWTPSENMEALK